MTEIFSKTKHPTYPIRIHDLPTSENAKIIGWMIKESPGGIFTAAQPQHLSYFGWIQVLCCSLVALPLSCVPCCLSCNYSAYQTPIFEHYDT